MPSRRGLLRVVWLPGSDLLQGTCHCGAVHVAEGPVEVWEWLLGHPTGHHTPTDPTPNDTRTDPTTPDAATGRARADVLPGTGAAR
ncbi:hypothetical protein AB0K16_49255 [Nonomuraea jabiensis]|uniref:hypothetical protein n=1 Tax=Nonomuraea jabiensis TaxID=882448 RepID=UPI00343E5C9B